MLYRDPSTYNFVKQQFDKVPEKNAHDLANETAMQPKDAFPGHNYSAEINRYYGKDIDYLE